MSLKLQIILVVIWLLMLFYLITQIRNRVVSIKHSLTWLILDLILIVLSVFPNILVWLGKVFGVETPSNMLFFFGFVLVLMIAYSHTVALSRLSEKQKAIAQYFALKEYEISETGEKKKEE